MDAEAFSTRAAARQRPPARPAEILDRRSMLAAVAALLLCIALPLAFWHALIGDILDRFRWDLFYFVSEATPWLLLTAGVAFLTPVALSAGRSPESRLYPRARNGYFGWGIVLYLMGLLLAVQVAQIAALSG